MNIYIHMLTHTQIFGQYDIYDRTKILAAPAEGGQVSANFILMVFLKKIKHFSYILFLTFQVPINKGCFQRFSGT